MKNDTHKPPTAARPLPERSLPDISWLDVKLGFRMLVKYPVLSLVGGMAITVAATLGVGASEFVRDMLVPDLPLDEGERIVRLYHVDSEAGRSGAPSLYDFVRWKGALESVEDLAAFSTTEQGLVTDQGEARTVSLASMTASAFRATRVSPRLGRFLTEADESESAPPVIVLGYDIWESLFASDPGVIGRTAQLAGSPATVVGVMPEGYAFPVNHSAWAPLHTSSTDLEPGTSRRVSIFGRLAADATLESARAELAVLGQRAAADFPDRYARLRPEVASYAGPPAGSGIVALANLGVSSLFVLLLFVVCANVATLVFARTITRQSEIAVRMALGATRKRIVLQLFAEALVLVSGATLIAMLIARWGLGSVARLFFSVQQDPLPPFWWNDALSPQTILYAGVLAFAAALMVGVVPALKATGGFARLRLNELSTGAGSGVRFGGMWTAVIVVQVAISVAFLPLAVSQGGAAFKNPLLRSTFPADRYVTAQLGRDAVVPPGSDAERETFFEISRQLFEEVKTRVAADPRVAGVALASGLSAMNHVIAPVEFLGDGTSPPVGGGVRTLLVEPAYLDMMGATAVAGRGLQPADMAPGSRSVLVNQTFVDRVLSGRNAVGGQLRYGERRGESRAVAIPEAGQTYEIVGVVSNLEIDAFGPGEHSVVYAPLTLSPVTPHAVGLVGMPQAPATQLYVRLRPGSEPVTAFLYDVIASVDPTLRLSELGTVEQAWKPTHQGERLSGWIFIIVASIVLTLSVAGIYALMSFTVSQRTREIAIRRAVGAAPASIVAAIFKRAFIQLGLGVAVGLLVSSPVLLDSESGSARNVLIVASLLFVAGLAACLVPIRGALRIHPAQAIKTG
jgi:putative ABC transport system permease protein